MFGIVAKNYRKLQTRAAAKKRKRAKSARYAAALLCGVCLASIATDAEARRSRKHPAPTTPVVCGTFHTVERGDTLANISYRAYGRGKFFQTVFEANRDLLPNANAIEIGYELLVPCLDGTGPATRSAALELEAAAVVAPLGHPTMHDRLPARDFALPADPLGAPDLSSDQPIATGASTQRATIEVASMDVAAASTPPAVPVPAAPPPVAAREPVATPTAPSTTEETSAPAATMAVMVPAPQALPKTAPIRALTGVLSSPSTDRVATEIGVIEELLTRSIRRVAPDKTLQVAHISDWDTHLSGLLLSGVLDIGFPWARPDCEKAGLGREARLLCDGFVFSRPLMEVELASFARSDDPIVTAAERPDLAGRTVCLPVNHHPFAVTEFTADVRVETAESADACFASLLLKKVDAVMLVRREAEQAIALYRLDDRVREVKSLAAKRTLHAIVPRQREDGDDYMRLIDAGLDELIKSGEWFRAVSRYQSTMLASAN